MNLTIKLGNLLDEIDIDERDVSKIEELEDYLQQANNAYQSTLVEGDVPTISDADVISDALYDQAMSVLRRIAPSSPLAKEVWETQNGDEVVLDGEFLELRHEFPMKSIATVKTLASQEYRNFKDNYVDGSDLIASLKLNGWGIEVFYKHGNLVKAVTRGRSNVKDITEACIQVFERLDLVEIPNLEKVELCSIRGELNLRTTRLEKAREFNPKIKHPLSAVQSILGASMPKEARQLLSFRAYNYLEHGFDFATRTDCFKYLTDLGFTTPLYFNLPDISYLDLDEVTQSALEDMHSLCEDDDYYSDGLVLQVDDFKVYKSMGGDSHADYGGIALKMGYWEQNLYSGYVQYVSWSKGKTKLNPVAVVGVEPNLVQFQVDGVIYEGFYDLKDNCPNFNLICAELDKYVINYERDLGVPTGVKHEGTGISGNRVRRVPVYNVAGMIKMGIKLGGEIHFRYDGESGVIPTTELGESYKSLGDISDYLYYTDI